LLPLPLWPSTIFSPANSTSRTSFSSPGSNLTDSPAAKLDVNGDILHGALRPRNLPAGYVEVFNVLKANVSTIDLFEIDPAPFTFAMGIIEVTYGTRFNNGSDATANVVKNYQNINGKTFADLVRATVATPAFLLRRAAP